MSEWSIIHGSCVSKVAFAVHRRHLSCALDQNSLKTREVPFDSQLGNMRHLGNTMFRGQHFRFDFTPMGHSVCYLGTGTTVSVNIGTVNEMGIRYQHAIH